MGKEEVFTKTLYNLGGQETPCGQGHLFLSTNKTQLFLKRPKPKTVLRIPTTSLSVFWSPRQLSGRLSSLRLSPGVCVCCWPMCLPNGSERREYISLFPWFKSPSPNVHLLQQGPAYPAILSFFQARLTGQHFHLPPCLPSTVTGICILWSHSHPGT